MSFSMVWREPAIWQAMSRHTWMVAGGGGEKRKCGKKLPTACKRAKGMPLSLEKCSMAAL